MRILSIVFCISLLLLITGCSSINEDAAEKTSPSSESQDNSTKNSASVNKNDTDLTVQTEVNNSMEYIVHAIMNSEIAGYIGKTEAKIEAKYGPIQSEGELYNGLLYTEHKNFSGGFGYGNADPGAVSESIESDSICNTIVLRLSEIMPISNINFNKDALEYFYYESEGEYYYTFKNYDVPIEIECDESGNIEQDPWIFIYLVENDSIYNTRLKKEELQTIWDVITMSYEEIDSKPLDYVKNETDMGIIFKNDTFEYEYSSKYSEMPTSITVYKNCDDQFIGPRGICIGDTFEQTISKFPQEKNWEINNGLFYGNTTALDVQNKEPEGGGVYKDEEGNIYEIVVTTHDYLPAIIIHFIDNKVTDYMIIRKLIT